MAGPRDIRAGRAYVELGTRDKFTAGLKKFGAMFKNTVGGIAAAGAAAAAATAVAFVAIGGAIAAGAANAVKTFADLGSELNDMSARTGMSVEGLSELGYAAKQTGADMGSLEAGIRKMQKAIGDAAAGEKAAVKDLAALGLSVRDLKNLKPEEQFKLIAARINAIGDPTARAAAAMNIFGKSGTQLLPMIAEVGALTEEFRELGLTMSTKDAKAADQLGDRFGTLQAVAQRASFVMGGALAPAVERVTNWLIKGVAATARWVDANRHTFRDVAMAGAKALEWLGGKIRGFADTAKKTLGGLTDALLAGDFKTAGELAVTHLQSAFNGLRGWFSDLWNDIAGGMVEAYLRGMAQIEKAKLKVSQVTTAIGDQKAIDSITKQIDLLQNELANMSPKKRQQAQAVIDRLRKERNDAMRQFEKGQEDSGQAAEIDKQLEQDIAKAREATQAKKSLDRASTDQTAKDLDEKIAKLNAAAAASREAAKWIPRADDVRAWINDASLPTPPEPEDIAEAIDKAKGTAARGQFGANSLQALKGSDQLEKQIADAVKETARNTDDIARAARKGLAFAP